MSLRRSATPLVLLTTLAACRGASEGAAGGGGATAPASAAVTPPSPSAESASARATSSSASAAASATSTRGDPGSACPADMRLVEGNLCPAVAQRCVEHHAEYRNDPSVSERCLRYEEPSRCLSPERKPIRVCVDTYEWPNRRGEKPITLVQWTEARRHCESVGKRLCDEEEWLFACEGEAMRPQVYGWVRDPSKCLIDRPYRKRSRALKRWEPCHADPECRAHFEFLDQRQPSGSFPECVNEFGVYDLNGNVNEWVNLPGKKYPDRSGLKGGWWGPVRNRCRPTVTFHKEDDWGYEAGFRCCKTPT